MKKSTITKTWVGGLAILAAGMIVAILGVFLMLAFGGTFTQAGTGGNYNFTPAFDSGFWTAIAVIVIGGVLALAGGVVQLAAWVGALVNSYQLADKTWFVVLLVAGVLGLGVALFGFLAMIAYVVAAPDGYAERRLPVQPPPQPLGAIGPTA